MPTGRRPPACVQSASAKLPKDLREDDLRLLKDFMIPKPQDPDSATFKHQVRRRFRMKGTVRSE